LRGNYSRAIPIYQEVIAVWLKRANLGAVARCIECLAFIAIHQENFEQAAMLLGAAEAVREIQHAPMVGPEIEEYARYQEELRSKMEQDALEKCWKLGGAFNLDQAVAFANQIGA
jgi:hypothetical protein